MIQAGEPNRNRPVPAATDTGGMPSAEFLGAEGERETAEDPETMFTPPPPPSFPRVFPGL